MKTFHCLSGQTIIYYQCNDEYGINSLFHLFNDRKDNVIYTLNDTQEEIDISSENIYVDNNGKWTKALKIIRHKRNPESPMVFIKSNSGYGITTQDNHRMIIKRKNNVIEYIEPKDLIINEDEMQISNIDIWQKEQKECFIDAYLLGCMIGDGSVPLHKQTRGKSYKRPDSLRIAAQKGEYENKIRNKLINIIKNTIKEPKINDMGIIIYDVKIAEEYAKKCGRYSYVKKLPSEFIYYNDETLAKILCGIIDTDGCIRWKNKNKKIILSIILRVNSEAIITQLMYILNKFKIKCNKSIIKNKDGYLFKNNGRSSKINHQMYELIINPTNNDLKEYFSESIKCEGCIIDSTRRNKNINNKIKSIKPILFKDDLNDSYVYDLETEDHEYSANMIHIKNTGGASKIIYLTKEAPQLKGIIRQDNNNLLSMKNIKIILEYYESDNVDEYVASIFKVEDMDEDRVIEVEFPADIIFSALNSSKLDSKQDQIILQYEPESTIGEINSEAVDATQNVRALQSTLTKAHQYNMDERGPRGLVEDLYSIFKMSSKVPLLYFEILVSQLIRDYKNPRVPYRYGDMKEKPIFVGIKKVPGLESSKRGVMFEQILDVVSKSLLDGEDNYDPRIKSGLEDLFDM